MLKTIYPLKLCFAGDIIIHFDRNLFMRSFGFDDIWDVLLVGGWQGVF